MKQYKKMIEESKADILKTIEKNIGYGIKS